VIAPLPIDLMPLLRCPGCRISLAQQNSGYECPGCGRIFSHERGVTRFVTGEGYAENFGFQWRRYARTQLDDISTDQDFRRKTGLTPEALKGKLVLDVGCGTGRFAEVATRWGAKVVGVDLSAAAEVAASNLADREFVALQADVFSLPFGSESFDCIYSIGVLHHTPNCEQAVKSLPQYLKPGGTLAVWLYSAYNQWYRLSDIYRKITPRLPAKTLHGILCVVVPAVNAIDSTLRMVPGIGRSMSAFVRYVFPVNRNSNRQWRVLDTFDWYSPRYQSKHTYEEVFRWFESCGIEDLHVGEVPVSVQGRKPMP
jgi:2-polyprenyl-3-methyl-5-hydroxy-6-metoxy-1,4-benzoquinol methylase